MNVIFGPGEVILVANQHDLVNNRFFDWKVEKGKGRRRVIHRHAEAHRTLVHSHPVPASFHVPDARPQWADELVPQPSHNMTLFSLPLSVISPALEPNRHIQQVTSK